MGDRQTCSCLSVALARAGSGSEFAAERGVRGAFWLLRARSELCVSLSPAFALDPGRGGGMPDAHYYKGGRKVCMRTVEFDRD